MTSQKLKYLFAAFFILTLLIAPASAHGVYMKWSSDETHIHIHAYYQGNDPMANCDVTVETIDNSGTASSYVTGKTDANGDYEFDIKEGVTAYRIKVVEGEHAITKKIDISSSSGGQESSGGWTWLIGTEGPSVFTVGAGIGWIVGIAGIFMYFQARKMNK